MATKRKFKTDAFEAIYSSASAMYKVGAIDKTTMRSSTHHVSRLLLPSNPSRSRSCASVFVSVSRCSPVTQYQRIDD
jgi:hypothetical protein